MINGDDDAGLKCSCIGIFLSLSIFLFLLLVAGVGDGMDSDGSGGALGPFWDAAAGIVSGDGGSSVALF